MISIKRFIFILYVLAIAACSSTNTPLSQNQQNWQNAAIKNYKFQLTVGCFCPWRDLMPLTIEVKDGQIISMTDAHGSPVPENYAESFKEAGSMDGLFTIIQKAQKDADEVRVEYDKDYGYPTSIFIDRAKSATDDELDYNTQGFEILK